MLTTTIQGSVGHQGANRAGDVRTIQAMLNDVPPGRGGAFPPLAVDGLAWQKTVAAIRRFQQIACGFQWPDGRVDPGGKTWTALVAESSGKPVPPAPPGPAAPAFTGYVVPGHRPALAQPSTLTCWATAYTILRSWRDRTSYDIAHALSFVGPEYVAKFQANQPLFPVQVEAFVRRAGMTPRGLLCLPIATWRSWLVQHGLIMIGAFADPLPAATNTLHIRVIEGIFGDGTPAGTTMMILDPAGGVHYTEPFATFNAKYELVPQTAALPLHVQIAHF